MSTTPIFDELYAESDEKTRALVWQAIHGPGQLQVATEPDICGFIEAMHRLGRALSDQQPPFHVEQDAARTMIDLGGPRELTQ